MDETLDNKETGASTVWPFSTRKITYTPQEFTVGAILPELQQADYKESERLFKELEERQERYPFWNMLVEYMPRSGFIPPTGQPILIYDLACGYAKESAVLSSYFGRALDIFSEGSPKEVEIVAMDIDKRAINEAKRAYEGTPNIKVKELDLTSEDWTEIDQLADLVLLRHPSIHAYRQEKI